MTTEATSWVTNASIKVGVRIEVAVLAGWVTNTSGVFVAGTLVGAGDEVGGMPPGGVGVAYCPHREAFPPHEASKNEAATRKLVNRFTKKVRL